MNKLRYLMLRWKMGFKCLWWLFKYRKENIVTAKVYLASHYQSPHLSELYYIMDQSVSPCFMSNFQDMETRVKTIFSPSCYHVCKSKRILNHEDNSVHILKLAPFSYVGMESGLSLMRLKTLYKKHNLKHIYTTVVRL